ncbi:MAG: class I SAM-dependent methyltransferase [Actinomycetota bacterium]|nr:class I SAM-dependent methyltransferase [Actinomycetota bacterium]
MTLFKAFLTEQTDPDGFYRVLADDSVRQLSEYTPLAGRSVLDVGGGPGYFSDAFRQAGAYYLGVDPDVGELSARGVPGENMVRASGTRLPVRTASVDVCYSSNVLEHVAEPWVMIEEMCRVTKPGGTVFVSFTPWYSPWGGHETAPWHFVGGDYARRRYLRTRGKEPKNKFGVSLFPLSVGAAVRWSKNTRHAQLRQFFPRYHPRWALWIARLPGVREIACWNLVLVFRKS